MADNLFAVQQQTDELATLRADAIKDAEAIGRMRAQQDLMQLEIDRLKADARATGAENARLRAVIEGAADAFQSGNDFEAEQIIRVGAKHLARTGAE